YVVTFLDDIYTQVEKTLIEAGERETVKQTRLAFQRAMEEKFTAAVENVMERKVVAFLSQVHFDPDLSQETFVLEPEGEDAARDGRPEAALPLLPRDPEDRAAVHLRRLVAGEVAVAAAPHDHVHDRALDRPAARVEHRDGDE